MTETAQAATTKTERPLILRIIYFCLIGWWRGSIWTLFSALVALCIFYPGYPNFLNFDAIPTMFSKVKTMYFL